MTKKMQITGILAGIVTTLGIMAALLGSFTGSFVTAPPADTVLGAIPGNEIQGRELKVGDSPLLIERQSFSNLASTTLCSFKLPNATTTPVRVSVKLSGNSNGTALSIAQGTDSNALTNVIARRTGAAHWTGDLVATTTSDGSSTSQPGLATNYGTLRPNLYINVGLTSATFATGTCSMILQQL